MSEPKNTIQVRKVEPLAPVGNPGTMRNLLEQMKGQIAEILPNHVRPERIMKAALVAINRAPKLLECTQSSIMQAIMQASELGLDPSGGTLGQGYLVPFKNKVKGPDGRDLFLMQATFIPGYRGLCDLARRGGEVRSIEAHVVYRGDTFEYELGTTRHLKHVPLDEEQLDKDITHAYAIAWMSEDDYQFEVMTGRQIDGIRERSKSKDNGPWVTDFAEMARKTVIRRLIKYLPISSEKLARAVELSDTNEFGQMGAGSIVEGATAAKNLNDRLKDAAPMIEQDQGSDQSEVSQSETPTAPLPEPTD